MGRNKQLSLIGEDNTWNKLASSPHWEYIINAVNNGIAIKVLWRTLNQEKKFKVSLPTVKKAVRYIKANNGNILKLVEKNRKAALDITEDVKKKIPSLSNTLKRRASLITELLERKKECLNAQQEGKRVEKLNELLDELNERLNIQDMSLIQESIRTIKTYITLNFTQYSFKPQLESLIKEYIMNIHEIFKYAEQWTAKYDIYNLLEKLSYDISSSAIKIFGEYLKDLDENDRRRVVEDFSKEVKRALKQIEVDELKIEDEENYDESKYN